MLIPGTTAWSDTPPVVLVTLALLVVPGLVTMLVLRVRPLLALAVAPAVSTLVVVGSGSVAALVGLPWSPAALLVGTVAAWLLALAARQVATVATRRWRRPFDGTTTEAGQTPRPTPIGAAPQAPSWALPLALLAGTAAAALVVGWVLLRVSGSPEAFPQHPDTIFHLGATQWMAANHDVSFQHGLEFSRIATNTSYPVGFHAMAATASLITGVPAVVAISVLVLVTAGVVWPFSMGVLAHTVFGGPAAGALGAVASVLFVGFPFALMGFGTIWPNLYGQALLPGVLTAVLGLTALIARNGASPGPVRTCVVATFVALPGLALAHPQAVITGVVLTVVAAWSAALRRLAAPAGTRWRWQPFVVVTAGAALAAVLSTLVAPAGMLLTGAAGPEMPAAEAWTDLLGMAPRSATPAPLLGVVVSVGCLVVVVLLRQALWVVPALALFGLAYYLNVAVDSPTARLLTWPWYNNAIRLAGVAVLPAALAVVAALLAPGRLAPRLVPRLGTRELRPWAVEAGVAALLVVALVVPVEAWAARDVRYLRGYFAPKLPERSWASPEELRALRELAAHLPQGAVVAADPWKGGTYMYVVGGARMLWPTEKTNTTPQRRLLGLRLDEVGSDPAVCAAALGSGVTHALTGGQAFLWGEERSRTQFAGVERVADSPAWREVARSGPYVLFERIACAT